MRLNERPKQTDPRIVRTRQMLKEAFVDLLEEMDVEKITVNRLAERATINRVTFYLHYKDIPDLMDKLAQEMIEEVQGILTEKTAASPIPSDQLIKLLEHIAANAKFFKIVLAFKRIPIFSDKLLRLLSELITERIESKRHDSNSSKVQIQKDIAIWFGSSALIGVIISWLRHDMPYSPRYLADQFLLLTSARSKE
ncbi:TetR/AcrR family transcriptional regulator [Cohnella terricola]|uniref:TetR/AcrR family transcriptional regulator n=1 Tax=Cohnella terricola TaxID=1289167 RepID=A0A559JQ88_9BACL|nr:TetR/AcrR family transcriptional regulator [Cohnella terricola]TVY02044.1 TetR/AcrR family transcriptional regulator [Cohnella terricola]